MSASIFEMNNVSLGSDLLKPLAHRMPVAARKGKYLFKSEYLPGPAQHRRVVSNAMPSVASLTNQPNQNYGCTESTPREEGRVKVVNGHLGSPEHRGAQSQKASYFQSVRSQSESFYKQKGRAKGQKAVELGDAYRISFVPKG
jgi:hypothetical protein